MATATNARASLTLDDSYGPESKLLQLVESTDESNRGKVVRALVRAGMGRTRSAVGASASTADQPGGPTSGQP